MSTIYDTEAKNLTIGEFSNAIDTINIIAKDPGVAKAFRKVIKTQFNPELIQLIRDIHADSETFCDEMREFIGT
jgi:hypothetical protein